MDRITSAKVFITIVEQGSMTSAATALDMSRSMVTRYLKEMEDWAGARLFHRSTRSITLTSAGEQILAQCQQVLAIADNIENIALSKDKEITGVLRVSASQFLAEEVLAVMVQKFLTLYPKVVLDLHVSNQTINLIEDRIDLAIRISNDLDPNLIARKLGQCHSKLCATPEYIKQNLPIKTLEDVSKHNCLTYSYFGNAHWKLLVNGQVESVPVQGNFYANESSVLLQAVLVNAGIAMLPLSSVSKHIAKGELVEILPKYDCVALDIHGVYRSREHMPMLLRKFIDFLVDEFKLLAI